MSRIYDAVLAQNKAYSTHSPAMDVRYGGQQGYMPRFGLKDKNGKYWEEWVSNHSYIKQNIIPIVLRYPKFFDYMPDKAYWIAGYKALLEEHPISIEGLSTGITVETDEEVFGGGGEYMEEPVDSKRERSQVNIQLPDKAGRSFQKLLNCIIRYGIKDPDTKKPLVSQYFDTLKDAGGIYTPDFYSGVVLFIEPDVTQQVVIDSWLCVNFFPKSDGDRTGRRDMKSPGERNVLNIQFASITMNNEATLILGDHILKQMTRLRKNPDLDMTPPLGDIDPAVKAVEYGFNRNSN